MDIWNVLTTLYFHKHSSPQMLTDPLVRNSVLFITYPEVLPECSTAGICAALLHLSKRFLKPFSSAEIKISQTQSLMSHKGIKISHQRQCYGVSDKKKKSCLPHCISRQISPTLVRKKNQS